MSSSLSNCILLVLYIQNCKKINISSSWQQTLEPVSSLFQVSRRGKREEFFFSFSINFNFFQVCLNSEHRATRMIWLWKLLISPSKESQVMVTEQLARSSKELLQHDPPGFLWALSAQGTTCGNFLKDKIILECLVSCSGKLWVVLGNHVSFQQQS